MISAFVSVLERVIVQNVEVIFNIGEEFNPNDYFSIEYKRNEPLIEAEFKMNEKTEQFIAREEDDIVEFAFFFKVLNLLSHFWVSDSGSKYIISQLQK